MGSESHVLQSSTVSRLQGTAPNRHLPVLIQERAQAVLLPLFWELPTSSGGRLTDSSDLTLVLNIFKILN